MKEPTANQQSENDLNTSERKENCWNIKQINYS